MVYDRLLPISLLFHVYSNAHTGIYKHFICLLITSVSVIPTRERSMFISEPEGWILNPDCISSFFSI